MRSTLFGSRWFARASDAIETPKRVAIAVSESPGRTVYVRRVATTAGRARTATLLSSTSDETVRAPTTPSGARCTSR